MSRLAVPDSLLAFLRGPATYVIVTHMDPDGDCIGSSLALSHFLSRNGCEAVQLNPGPFDRAEIAEFATQFRPRLPDELKSRAERGEVVRCVVLDASTVDRIGEIGDDIGKFPTAVIDHHSSGEPFGDIRYIDPTSPSASYLVHRTLEALGAHPDRTEAEHLLFALATDTGYFRFLDESSGDVLESAGRLIHAGASPALIYDRMYGGRSLASRELLGTLLKRTEAHCGGRLLVSWETREDEQRYEGANKDSAALYQLLMTVDGCEAILFLRELDETTCTGSLRSSNDLDVGKIAVQYGGGGHARAAGFLAKRPLAEIREELVLLLCTQLGRTTK